jgi:deoxyribodipyrimidine photolyase-related protein
MTRYCEATKRIKRLKLRGTAQTLAIVFGDQLDRSSPLFDELDAERDAILMMEVREEATHVASHKQRTTMFFSAMRHFALELYERGFRVHYVCIDDPDPASSFDAVVKERVQALQAKRLLSVQPGEWRVLKKLRAWEAALGVTLEILSDTHFYTTPSEFAEWAAGRKELTLEYFYRAMRKRFDVLMARSGKPVGGKWNFDKENREPFRGDKPPTEPLRFEPDAITRDVMRAVDDAFPDAPGATDGFAWPVTHGEAQRALSHFVRYRLADFGRYQDAMVAGEPWMYHAQLSPAFNLKLLNPREAVEAAVGAYERGSAPLNSVEGFVRQLLGWREFIRGVYWTQGERYGEGNHLRQYGDLPGFYWTGETDMNCMQASLGQVIEFAYGHHIQRLMVTGNFALISGVHPHVISDWYLAMYVDAVDWVTLPNTLGMVMHADGGVVGTKPYAASGQYIKRMSNYCDGCRYDPGQRTGPDACPFSVFYWDFLLRNEGQLRDNQRMALVLKNLDRLADEEADAIRKQARQLRQDFGIGGISR